MNTRRYAKRQLTWFRRNENIHWVHPDLCSDEELHKSVDALINKFLAGDLIE